jgi:hypothetical protein
VDERHGCGWFVFVKPFVCRKKEEGEKIKQSKVYSMDVLRKQVNQVHHHDADLRSGGY